ncbi:MAG: ABC transporter ATP-binding protein [Treponema sp.]|nr:ABC transporter ATP-binding protein [Treponema sp.]
MGDTLLQIKNLRTSFRVGGQYYAAVDGVDLTVNKNETFAIVGESGCGKSAMALSITRLHNLDYTRIEGEVNFDGKNLISLSERALNKVRGHDISMVFQDPLTSLNPLFRVGPQIEESLVYHTDMGPVERKNRAIELLDEVGIENPSLAHSMYPHELSGGMRQRAMIAIGLSCSPALIICDEPTTALDVTIQAQILDLLRKLKKEHESSIILITHDLGVVAEMADRIAVMYAGQIVELASCHDIFSNPLHPYTRSLISSIPSKDSGSSRLHVIQGTVPSLKNLPRKGCRFSPRIPWIDKSTHEEDPTLKEVEPNHFVLCSCYKDFYFNYEVKPGRVSKAGEGV